MRKSSERQKLQPRNWKDIAQESQRHAIECTDGNRIKDAFPANIITYQVCDATVTMPVSSTFMVKLLSWSSNLRVYACAGFQNEGLQPPCITAKVTARNQSHRGQFQKDQSLLKLQCIKVMTMQTSLNFKRNCTPQCKNICDLKEVPKA